MSEMALTADHLIVIGRGRIITDGPVDQVIAQATTTTVRVRSPHAARIAELVAGPGVTVASPEPGLLELHGIESPAVGEAAAREGLVLHELTPVRGSLEEAYMSLTSEAVEYHSSTVPGTHLDGPAAATAEEATR
jgi:ABC-2 type transport system ATP-binding protein